MRIINMRGNWPAVSKLTLFEMLVVVVLSCHQLLRWWSKGDIFPPLESRNNRCWFTEKNTLFLDGEDYKSGWRFWRGLNYFCHSIIGKWIGYNVSTMKDVHAHCDELDANQVDYFDFYCYKLLKLCWNCTQKGSAFNHTIDVPSSCEKDLGRSPDIFPWTVLVVTIYTAGPVDFPVQAHPQ